MTSCASKRSPCNILWIAGLCLVSLSAYTPHWSGTQRTWSLQHIPVKFSDIDVLGDQKRLLLSAAVAAIVGSVGSSSKASQTKSETGVNLSHLHFPVAMGIFYTGYKLEVGQYRTLIESLSPAIKLTTFAAADDTDSTIESLYRDANGALKEVIKLGYGVDYLTTFGDVRVDGLNGLPPLLLMGHSRGGSVVALAALMYLEIAVARRDFSAYPPKILLVLVDPVDSSESAVLRTLHDSLASDKKENVQNDTENDVERGEILIDNEDCLADKGSHLWPWPVLIISTPYGGYSSYYKTSYESACAPLDRNGAAFTQEMRGCRDVDSKRTSVAYLSAVGVTPSSQSCSRERCTIPSTVINVVMSDVGHFQLLDDRRISVLGSVCAANEKIPDSDVRGFVQELTSLWVAWSLNPRHADSRLKILEIKHTMESTYPNIKTLWST